MQRIIGGLFIFVGIFGIAASLLSEYPTAVDQKVVMMFAVVMILFGGIIFWTDVQR
jgi:hypothetical protein